MTGDEFRKIRTRLGLSRAVFGYALGYQGRPQNVNSLIGRMEKDAAVITPMAARLALMYKVFGVPKENLPVDVSWSKEEPE